MKPWMARRNRFAICLSAVAVVFISSLFPTKSSALSSAPSRAGEVIRVRLDRVRTQFTVTGLSLRYPGSPMASDLGFKAIKVSLIKGRGLHKWLLEDRDSGKILSEFQARKLEIAGVGLRVNLKSVPDRLSFVPIKNGADLIATMDLEEYLRGVIPSEMPSNWPLEALKAQAVAARTYALYRKSLRDQFHFDVESDVMDQVFTNPLGLAVDKKISNAERAVRETRGVLLLNRQGLPLASFFHADCGGRTEEAREIWGGGEKQGTAVDGFCPLNPAARWKVSLSSSEIAGKLKAFAPPESRLASLDVVDRTGSGRLAHLKLKWSDGQSSIVSGHEFRMAIGHDRIKSTSFEFVRKGEAFEFVGQGFGHGVGMCQWGAKSMASSGAFYSEILQHYYPKAMIKEPTLL